MLLRDCEDFVENAKPEEIRFLRDILVTWRLHGLETDLPIAESFNMMLANLPGAWLKVDEARYQEVKRFAECITRGAPTVPVGDGWHIWKNPRLTQQPPAQLEAHP